MAGISNMSPSDPQHGERGSGSPALGGRAAEPRTVTCEQLILTSSPYVLSGGGFGPVAASAGWPYVLNNDASGGLGKFVRYTDRADAPPTLTVVRLPDGNRCFLHKAAAGTDAIGRPGRIIVHALLAPAEALHPKAALGVPPSTFVTEWPQTKPSDPALPTVSVEVAKPSPPKDDAARSDVLAAVLDHLDGGMPVTLRAAHPSEVVEVLSSMFYLLPAALTRELSFSTFELDDKNSPLAICAVRSTGSAERAATSDRQLLDLTEPADLHQLPKTQLAQELLDRYRTGMPIPELATVDELAGWLSRTRLLTLDPSTLDINQVEQILDSDDAASWLDNPGDAALRQAVSCARTAAGRRTADLLARQLTADEKQTIAAEALAGMAQRIIDGKDVAADEYLISTLTGRPPDVTDDIVSIAIGLLERGQLAPSMAALVLSRRPALADDLDLHQQILWLVVDRSPLPSDHSRNPWAFAFLVGHLAGWLDAPPPLGPWLAADRDYVLDAVEACAGGVIGPGGARSEASTVLTALAALAPEYRPAALELVLRSQLMPRLAAIRRIATKGPASSADLAHTPKLWPLFGQVLGLHPDFVDGFELTAKPRARHAAAGRRWLPWSRGRHAD
jgi:hypothetical protein